MVFLRVCTVFCPVAEFCYSNFGNATVFGAFSPESIGYIELVAEKENANVGV
jgi:hypothetical protein